MRKMKWQAVAAQKPSPSNVPQTSVSSPPLSCPQRAVVAIKLSVVIKWPCCCVNGILVSAAILLSNASFLQASAPLLSSVMEL